MKLVNPKTGDKCIAEPGSEGEAIMRAHGWVDADKPAPKKTAAPAAAAQEADAVTDPVEDAPAEAAPTKTIPLRKVAPKA
jgi:hypothetical protein